MALIFLMMWLYSGSVAFTALAFAQIMLAVGLAYAIYFVVFQMPFFPFINMCGIFLCLGIGADDVFVFVDCFSHISGEYPSPEGTHIGSNSQSVGTRCFCDIYIYIYIYTSHRCPP